MVSGQIARVGLICFFLRANAAVRTVIKRILPLTIATQSAWFRGCPGRGQRKSTARRPASMIKAAAPRRARPESVTLRYFLLAHAVTGQAARPENIANQPWVGGHGPVVMISPNPPHPARRNQNQAAVAPMSWAPILQLDDLFPAFTEA